ncbi:MAG TPA: amino acid adenylation domain-containing protein [Chloroflexia bacterium]|nr:amino acid adenylation domain-containing protein [Chloroflexia bacterium]
MNSKIFPGADEGLAERQELLAFLLEEEGISDLSERTIPVREDNGPCPLSFAQERLWFFEQLEPGKALYNLPRVVRISGSLDPAILERSLNEVVNRHEVLRTSFGVVNGQPVQLIAPPLPLSNTTGDPNPGYLRLSLVDLRHYPPAERQAHAQDIIADLASQPFDLSQAPLLRATLLRLGHLPPTHSLSLSSSPQHQDQRDGEEEEHVLVLAMHHIVTDGWSTQILVEEVGAFYQALSYIAHIAGADATSIMPVLPALPIQYADYAAWQRQWLQGPALDAQLAYWRQQLIGSTSNPLSTQPVQLEPLQLPTDRPRPPVQTYRGAKHWLRLPKKLKDRVAQVSRQEGVTPFMTLLAAYQTLLYRYTAALSEGKAHISVGTAVANRNRAELEGLIGLFVNTLVMRTDLSGNPTFTELLKRVKEVTLGAYSHQDVPFEKLVAELQPQRDLSHNPLFQVMFDFQQDNIRPIRANDGSRSLTLKPVPVESGVAKFDLTLYITESEQELLASFEYNTDLFDAATIARMSGHFEVLLEGIVANPGKRISDLPLLTQAEQEQIVMEWNATHRDYPTGKRLHQLFEEQVEKTPDGVAVSFEGEHLTYRELNSRANQLAHHLIKLGVGPEKLVGICMERSIGMVAGILGILKAGGAYVPLDPTYPQERIAFMLQDCQAGVVITHSNLAGSLPLADSNVQIVCLDTVGEGEREDNPQIEVSDKNLAYVIYTSGSTGIPKGAMNTHSGICNRLTWMQEAYGLTGADRVLQKTPFSFDVSVWEFFWPLITGARLVVARPEGHKDSAYLAQLIAEQEITTLHFVPSMLQVFLQEPALETLSCLKRVICSGEALPFNLQQRFYSRLDAELHNLYGPTEAAVDVTFWACERKADSQVVPIGRPIANTQIYILDGHLQPVPVGVAGELYIGGVGLARGYFNRPSLTAEKFIPNPFVSTEYRVSSTELLPHSGGERLYRTGDLARFAPDGSIEYLGRTDDQVKIRGNRVELGEIEAVLGQHPSVREAVVVARKDVPGDERLVAYLVCSPQVQNGESAIGEIRAFLKERVPDYMLPSQFVVLESLPLSPNGKVERRALPAPPVLRMAPESGYVAPVTGLERSLAGVWKEVLSVEKVGVHDNFFDLGGHSLLMAQVRGRLQEVLARDVPMLDLFRYPTISSLAKYLSQEQSKPPSFEAARERVRKQEEAVNRRKRLMAARVKSNG